MWALGRRPLPLRSPKGRTPQNLQHGEAASRPLPPALSTWLRATHPWYVLSAPHSSSESLSLSDSPPAMPPHLLLQLIPDTLLVACAMLMLVNRWQLPRCYIHLVL